MRCRASHQLRLRGMWSDRFSRHHLLMNILLHCSDASCVVHDKTTMMMFSCCREGAGAAEMQRGRPAHIPSIITRNTSLLLPAPSCLPSPSPPLFSSNGRRAPRFAIPYHHRRLQSQPLTASLSSPAREWYRTTARLSAVRRGRDSELSSSLLSASSPLPRVCLRT